MWPIFQQSFFMWDLKFNFRSSMIPKISTSFPCTKVIFEELDPFVTKKWFDTFPEEFII